MKNGTVTPEEYIEFVVGEGLKNVPELIDMIPEEEIYKILKENIKIIYESKSKYSTWNGVYNSLLKSICVRNGYEKFDISVIKNNKSVSVHEAIHALFRKKIGTGPRTFDKNVSIRNIKGFFKGKCKFKYKGSLISKYFDLIELFSGFKGRALNEGFTEWLSGKVCGYPSTYENQVNIINQIEKIIGTRQTMEIGKGNHDQIANMIKMNKEDYDEFLAYTDEHIYAERKENRFNMLVHKMMDNKLSILEISELVDWGLNPLKKDMPENYEKIEEINDYFRKIKNENLIKAEEILLDNLITKEIQGFLDKKDLGIDELDRMIGISDSICDFILCSSIDYDEFQKNKSYLKFKKQIQNVMKKYKIKLNALSISEIRFCDSIINNMELEDDEQIKEFKTELDCKKKEYFYQECFPEIKDRLESEENISLSDLYFVSLDANYYIDMKEFWEIVLKREISDEDAINIENELFLIESYGIKLNKSNLVRNDEDSNLCDIIVDGKIVGKESWERVKSIYEGEKSFFDDSRFFVEEKICNKYESMNFMGIMDEIQEMHFNDGNYKMVEENNESEEEKQKFSFKKIIGRLLKNKSISFDEISSIRDEVIEEDIRV